MVQVEPGSRPAMFLLLESFLLLLLINFYNNYYLKH